eukprot:TRINITY_DN9758_c0_g1_i1.p1 TRINITY_DN9758_c0_g1~~TRINITY_DN9758_c0_g1_i1.p1  ORF type:complete len:240 (+),score=67.70 TRINITY_DN9758_c0_g1_i1:183-902(+)
MADEGEQAVPVENADEHSDGWSGDEEETKQKAFKISKKQYKKDRKDEEGRLFERGNYREDVCGMVDIILKMGHNLLKGAPGGKALFVKVSFSWPKESASAVSELLVTSEGEQDLMWDHVFDGLLVYEKTGNVSNKFFRYPSLVVKLKQKGTLKSKTVSSGELHLAEVIRDLDKKPSEGATGETSSENAAGEGEGEGPGAGEKSERDEFTVPMLTPSGVRQGEVVLVAKFTRGKREFRPL